MLAYKRYREIANLLSERETAGLRTYLRLAPPPKVEGTVDLSGITLADLSAAALALFNQDALKPTLSSVVAAPRITIREKITYIATALRRQKNVTFLSLFNRRRTRLEMVVTFLAMLELVKRHLVNASQEFVVWGNCHRAHQ